jgi:hypothetical protein
MKKGQTAVILLTAIVLVAVGAYLVFVSDIFEKEPPGGGGSEPVDNINERISSTKGELQNLADELESISLLI